MAVVYGKQTACLATACSGERAGWGWGTNRGCGRTADPANGDGSNRFSGVHAAAAGALLPVAGL